jgi:CBS domain-containing protein
MADDLYKLGAFSEEGRGVPVTASRPGGALPFSPIVRQAYAPSPRARLGWAGGVVAVADVPLEPPLALESTARPAEAAARMLCDESDFVPIVDEGRFVGVVYGESLLRCIAVERTPTMLTNLVSAHVPTCRPSTMLVDAVREMLACHVCRLPVLDDRDRLLGLLTLAASARAGERDPAVGDALDDAAGAFARYACR